MLYLVPNWLLIFFVSFLGISLGSLLNVLILRFKPEEDFSFLKIIKGRSMCPKCGKMLAWFELIPIFSFIFLRGRCRGCKGKISWQYIIIEFLTAIIFVAVAYRFWHSPFLIMFWWLIGFYLILISVIDFYHYLIPNVLVRILFIIGFAMLLGQAVFLPTVGYHSFAADYDYLGYYWNLFPKFSYNLLNHLIGLFSFSSLLFIISVASNEKYMGMGDAKLVAALGFIVGWPAIILIFVLSFILGALAGLILMAARKKSLNSALPFGPFIAISALIIALYGEQILRVYFKIVGL